ncbi:hypothetical protein ABW20_dc0107473 [Dactylellina cionopaga]|nr:hypothetical protein ABW20_dc0107473 [Dactylellina cionopaga]
MGQGGHLEIVNGTEKNFNTGEQKEYQLKCWPFKNFPNIPAGGRQTYYIEFEDGFTITTGDTLAKSMFAVDGTSHWFGIEASYQHLKLFYQFPNLNSGVAFAQELGWKHNGTITLVIAGSAEHSQYSVVVI